MSRRSEAWGADEDEDAYEHEQQQQDERDEMQRQRVRRKGEILTLQFGSWSNFIGAHFWNLQDEQAARHSAERSGNGAPDENAGRDDDAMFDSSLLYKSGRDHRGNEVATPRAMMFDLPASMGALSSLGTIDTGAGGTTGSTSGLLSRSSHAHAYGMTAGDRNAMAQRMAGSVWSGGVDSIISAPEQASSFVNWLEQTETNMDFPNGAAVDFDEPPSNIPQQLSTADTKWGDFLKVRLHPRSVQVLPRGINGMTNYADGEMFVENHKTLVEDYEDKIRLYLEECDQLQAIHCFVDAHSGFGALANVLIRELRDQVKSAALINFGISADEDQDTQGGESTIAAATGAAGSNGNSSQARSRRAYQRHVNAARCFAALGDDRRSLYVPLNLGGLTSVDLPGVSPNHFNPYSRFHLTAAVATVVDTALSPVTRGDLHAAHMLSNLVPAPRRNMGTLSGVFPCDLSWADGLADDVRSAARAQAFNRVLRESVGRPALDASDGISNSKTQGANAIVSEAIKLAVKPEHQIRFTDYSLASRREAMRSGRGGELALDGPQVYGQVFVARGVRRSRADAEALDVVVAEHTEVSPSMFAFTYADRTAVPLPYPSYFNEPACHKSGLSEGERFDIPSATMLQTSNLVLPQVQQMHSVLNKVPAWCAAQRRISPDALTLSDAWDESNEYLARVVSAYGGGGGGSDVDSDLDM